MEKDENTYCVGKDENANRDMFGEVGALSNMPQPFTFRTAEMSQLLRIRRTRLIETAQNHREDDNIYKNILRQVYLKF